MKKMVLLTGLEQAKQIAMRKRTFRFLIVAVLLFSCASSKSNMEPFLSPNKDKSASLTQELEEGGGYHVYTRKTATMRTEPFGSELITTIPPETKILLLDYDIGYWKIIYNDEIGYVNDMCVQCPEDVKKHFPGKLREEKAKKIAKLTGIKWKLQYKKVWVKSFKVNLREGPSTDFAIIKKLEQGDELYVQEQKGNWLRVLYEIPNITNGLNSVCFESVSEFITKCKGGWIASELVSRTAIKKLSTAQKRRIERRVEFVDKHPNISNEFKQAILNGEIILGMTEGMVIASWGPPQDKHKSVGEWGIHEQWIYHGIYDIMRRRKHEKHLFFKNGKLTSWEEW